MGPPHTVRVPGLSLVVILRRAFGERFDRGQLSSSSSRELVDQLACLSLSQI